jgi:hypothetical protein
MSLNETSQQFASSIATDFLATIMQKVQEDTAQEIRTKIHEFNVPALLQEQITDIIIPYFDREVRGVVREDVQARLHDQDVQKLASDFISEVVIPRVEAGISEQIKAEIIQRLQAINLPDIARTQTATIVNSIVNEIKFPDRSIPGSAVDPSTLEISANRITPGMIKAFQSTGIQDSASKCQVTILDVATVFENRLVAGNLEIAGDAVFRGNVSIDGTLPRDSAFVGQLVDLVVETFNTKYDQGTFDQYVDRVFDKLNESGLDVAAINHKGQSLVTDATLSGTVINSNLQTVGALKELQVIGETLLDQTLYVSNGRIGLNTMDPERVFDMWDQEVQIVAGKRKQDTAIFGTARNQNLIISANGRDQLTVNTDGSVSVTSLNIGRTNHTSASRMPTDNRPVGQIVWNEQPIIGSAVGWVSLGGARWASFGLITG